MTSDNPYQPPDIRESNAPAGKTLQRKLFASHSPRFNPALRHSLILQALCALDDRNCCGITICLSKVGTESTWPDDATGVRSLI